MILGLKKWKKLNRLIINLKGNRCSNDCIDFFLSDFKKVKKLEKLNLDLSINRIKDKGALWMLEILKFSLENLQVDLKYNWISNKTT